MHNRFHRDHHDNDLAILELASPLHFGPALIHLCLPTKDFSENILMHSGRAGMAASQNLDYMTLDECRGQMNVSHQLSNKMFCMKSQNGSENSISKTDEGGRLLPGTPVATMERGTAFLTGLLISSPKSHQVGSGGLVFTKLSRHLSWIRPRVKAAEDHMTPQVIQYPEDL